MKPGARASVDSGMLLITPTTASGDPMYDNRFWADHGVQHVLLMSSEHLTEIVQGVRAIVNWGNQIAWAKPGMIVGLIARSPHERPIYGVATVAEVLIPGPLPPNPSRGPADPWNRNRPQHPQYVGDYAVRLEAARPL